MMQLCTWHDDQSIRSKGFTCFVAALPQIPGVKKKRGRPSKADLAARETFKAAQEAKEVAQAEAAVAAAATAAVGAAAAKPPGKLPGKPAVVPLPTADLDPPAQQSASPLPAAPNAAAAKPAGKKPTVATAAESAGKGPSAKGRSLSPKGRSATDKLQKSTTTAPASPGSPAHAQQALQQSAKHAMLDEDADDDDDSMPLGAVAAAAPKAGPAKALKRLKKQPPASVSDQKQTLRNAIEDEEAALGQSHAMHAKHCHSSGRSQEQPFSPGCASHVEIFVDAVGLPADLAGCARARPWTKHKQKAAAEAQAAAQAAQELAAEQQAALASQLEPAPAAPPAAATAAVKGPTAVAGNQGSAAQVGSGGRSQAAAAELSGQKEFLSKKRLKKDNPAGNEAQQQDQHSQVQKQHAPRGSRTSPRSPLPLPVDTQRDDSRTGTSQPRTGHSQPRSIQAADNGNNAGTRRTQHRQTGRMLQQAPASPSDEARSGDSSDNATVQHGVGHTGESSEVLPASLRSSKPALQRQQQHRQRQQQQQHDRPTSSLSEQAIHSAAGNTKSQPPGGVLVPVMQSCLRLHACEIIIDLVQFMGSDALLLSFSPQQNYKAYFNCLSGLHTMYEHSSVFVHAVVARHEATGNMPCAVTKIDAAKSRAASIYTLSRITNLEVSAMSLLPWHSCLVGSTHPDSLHSQT